MNQEWWVTAAVSDARLVAELLVRLKDSAVVDSFPPPSWGARQPRSSVEKKKRDTRRRSSPTTPLSAWSDDSSADHPPPSDRFRSKITASSTESPSSSTSFKRRAREKTFEELKDEESSLLKERTHLKKELAGLQVTLDEQRSVNNNLKRRKVNHVLISPIESSSNSKAKSIGPKEEATAQNVALKGAKCEEDSQEPHSCLSQHKCEEEPSFVLPDLNMMPDEDCHLNTTFLD